MSLFRRKPKEPVDTIEVIRAITQLSMDFNTAAMANDLGSFFREVRNSEPLQKYLQSTLAPKLAPHILTQNLPKVVEVVNVDPVVGPFVGPIVTAFLEAFNGK